MPACSNPPRHRRAHLLAGCAVAAAFAAPSLAQTGFQATPNVVTGSGTATVAPGQAIPGGLRDVVTVTAPQAVIDWTPTVGPGGNGAIAVLPQGNELLFTADPANVGGNYTVLNRVIPTDPSNPIQFDGLVKSQFDSGYGATSGGNIWFYSPGGIILGATSQFDVGSLVLSANDIDYSNGLFGDGATSQAGTIRFRGAANSQSFVTVQPGAQVNASGNYLALVAPRITQGGALSVNGSAALVAAEVADLTIPVSGGLFDISVSVGSAVDAPGDAALTHSGTTASVDPQASAGARRVYLMAVPKNDAVTMLVSGNLGYDAAAQAQVSHGAIVLTTATELFGGDPSAPERGTIKVTGGDFGGSLTMGAQDITIDTSTAAINVAGDLFVTSHSGAIDVTARDGRDISVAGYALLKHDAARADGASSISVTANGGSSIQVGTLDLYSFARGADESGYGEASTAATGSLLSVNAAGGIITAQGGIHLDSSAAGGDGFTDAGAAGTGGTTTLTVSAGGQVSAGSSITLQAEGHGGNSSSTAGGDGIGGSATIVASSGTVEASNIFIGASAVGGDGRTTGGAARGGTAQLSASAGDLTLAMGEGPSLGIESRAIGGFGLDRSGDAIGGTSGITLAGTNASLHYVSIDTSAVTRDIAFNDSSFPPRAANGGNATGGQAQLDFTGATVSLDRLVINANGEGGNGFDLAAGNGKGGAVQIAVSGGSLALGTLDIEAQGLGGGGQDFFGQVQQGGTGTGGEVAITLSALDASDIGDIFVNASGRGGDGAAGGSGDGGAISIASKGGATLGILDFAGLYARGYGQSGTTSGGGATGGRVELSGDGGTVRAAYIDVDVEAIAGDAYGESVFFLSDTASASTSPGFAGSATGGAISLVAANGGSIAANGYYSAFAGGGSGFSGIGAGDATGGTITLKAAGGMLDLGEGTTSFDASGSAGGSFGNSFAPTGRGGVIDLQLLAGAPGDPQSRVTFGTLSLTANGSVADLSDGGIGPGNAGTGIGGSVSVTIASGNLIGDVLDLGADGLGGNAPEGGRGGTGHQGRSAFTMSGGSAVLNEALRLQARARGGDALGQGEGDVAGSGGHAGVGSNPFGAGAGAHGTITGGTLTTAAIELIADSEAGRGGDASYYASTPVAGAGGDAVGGAASFNVSGSASLDIPAIILSAQGLGGQGGDIEFGYGSNTVPSTTSGAGGKGQGGTATVQLGGTNPLLSSVDVNARGVGGRGGGFAYVDGAFTDPLGTGGAGGAGSGGLVTLGLNATSSPGASLFADADGVGGDGGEGPVGAVGGTGRGGTALIALGGGTHAFTQLVASAEGQGGRGGYGFTGDGGRGGDAAGGSAQLDISGTLTDAETNSLVVNGQARGGQGGSGGFNFDAAGAVPRGGDGGDAVGGLAMLSASSGRLRVTGIESFAELSVAGFGGDGGEGGIQGSLSGPGGRGGNGSGGAVIASASGGDIRLGLSLLEARGFGGSGGFEGGYGTTASADGTRLGGSIVVESNAPASTPVLGFATLEAHGADILTRASGARILVDGSARYDSTGPVRFDFDGAAGLSAGSTVDIASAGDITIDHRNGSGPSLAATSIAAQAGGSIAAGTSSLQASTIDLVGALDVGAGSVAATTLDASAGRDVIAAPGAAIVADQAITFAAGNDIVIGQGTLVRAAANPPPETGYGASDPLEQASQLRLLAGRNFVDGPVEGTPGSIVIDGTVEAPGRTLFMSAGAVAGSATSRVTAGNFYVRLFNVPQMPASVAACTEGSVCLGAVNVSGIVRIGETGFEPINLRLSGGIEGSDVLLRARSIELGEVRASDRLLIEATAESLVLNGPVAITGGAQATRIAAARDIVGAEATLATPGTLDLFAGGSITLGGMDAATIRTVAFDGSVLNANGITLPGTATIGRLATRGPLLVDAANGIAIDTLASTGTATLTAASGDVVVSTDAVTGGLTATGRNVSLAGLNGLNVISATATEGHLSLTTAAGDLRLDQATVSGGDIVVASGGNVRLGDVSAVGALAVTATGGIAVDGGAAGSTIAFASRDLAIGASGQIGSRSVTRSISLTSTADRLLLGDAPGTGYRIDNGELARIVSGGDLTIASAPENAQGAAYSLVDPTAANVVIGTMSFDGAQLGASGTFRVETPRSIGITGAVRYANFGSGQTVTYAALGDIALAAETGQVTLRNAAGGLSGTLRLEAQQIHAMSSTARGEIAGLGLNEVRQRLGTNDQIANDGGYFQAGAIIARIGRLLFIQNSGTNGSDVDARRGFSADSFRIEATGTSAAQVVVNGRIGSATGAALAGSTQLSGSFDPQSGFNGCLAGAGCAPVVIPDPGPGPGPQPGPSFDPVPVLVASREQARRDEAEDEAEEALKASQNRPDPVIQFVDAPSSRFDPVIDEPVTGAGNEDLWLTPTSPTP